MIDTKGIEVEEIPWEEYVRAIWRYKRPMEQMQDVIVRLPRTGESAGDSEPNEMRVEEVQLRLVSVN